MTVDVAAFIGPYAYRHLEHHSASWLLAQMDRLNIDQAWVGYLPAFLYRDPGPGNRALQAATENHDRLRPVPTVRPGMPGWAGDLHQAVEIEAPAVRVYPTVLGIDPAGSAMRDIVAAAADHSLPVLLTVRLEDARQRGPLEPATDLPASAVRTLARTPVARLVVSGADRSFVEEVHFGLTDEEAQRVLWDISVVWGPPENHLEQLLTTVGVGRFVFGTGAPLRIADAVVAKIDLLDVEPSVKQAIFAKNVRQWSR